MSAVREIICSAQQSLWTDGGEYSDTLFFCSLSLRRNHALLPFREQMNDLHRARLFNDISGIKISDNDIYITLKNSDDANKTDLSLLEEREILRNNDNPDCCIMPGSPSECVTFNGNSHITISIISGKARLPLLFQRASEIDDIINRSVPFAFSEKHGYLFSDPSDCGSGVEVSAVLHIPSLSTLKCYPEIKKICNEMNLALSAYPDEYDSENPLFCRISTANEPGISETDQVEKVRRAVSLITDLERDAREEYYYEFRPHVDDAVCRSLGVLRHARMIGYREAFEYLSHIRLGIMLSIVKGFSVADINGLFFDIRRTHLSEKAASVSTQLDVDQARADLLRSFFSRSESCII